MTGRIQFWETIIDKIMESPLLGYGYYSSARVLFDVPGADNSYLTVMLGGGIVLLIIFLIPIFIGSYHIYLARPSKSRELGAGYYISLWMQVAGLFIILLTRSLTGPSFDAHHISLILYLLTLIGAECLYRNRRNIADPGIEAKPEPLINEPERAHSKILRRRKVERKSDR
jgi:O-antigen ligase